MWEDMESLKNGMTKELVKWLQGNKPKKRVMYKVGLIVEGFLDKDSEHIIMRFFFFHIMKCTSIQVLLAMVAMLDIELK